MDAVRQEAMQRKQILMPAGMIMKVDRIAKKNKVSFAGVVREAVDAFDSMMSNNEAAVLDALAETMIDGVKDTIDRINEVEEKLDATHRILRVRHGNQ